MHGYKNGQGSDMVAPTVNQLLLRSWVIVIWTFEHK